MLPPLTSNQPTWVQELPLCTSIFCSCARACWCECSILMYYYYGLYNFLYIHGTTAQSPVSQSECRAALGTSVFAHVLEHALLSRCHTQSWLNTACFCNISDTVDTYYCLQPQTSQHECRSYPQHMWVLLMCQPGLPGSMPICVGHSINPDFVLTAMTSLMEACYHPWPPTSQHECRRCPWHICVLLMPVCWTCIIDMPCIMLSPAIIQSTLVQDFGISLTLSTTWGSC